MLERVVVFSKLFIMSFDESSAQLGHHVVMVLEALCFKAGVPNCRLLNYGGVNLLFLVMGFRAFLKTVFYVWFRSVPYDDDHWHDNLQLH